MTVNGDRNRETTHLSSQATSGESDAAASRLTTLLSKMTAPVDIAPLVYFRIVFGAILVWEATRYFSHGWIERYYIAPEFFFKYRWFEWVQPWPGLGMYAHFIVLALLAGCVMLGFFYRVTSALLFLAFTYVFLLDQANYLNHFYLISLLSFILVFLPTHHAVSLDAGRKPELRSSTAPAWTLWLLRFQLAVPYVYGGIAKINGDWLQAEPMRMWLAEQAGELSLRFLLMDETVVYAFSYGGLLFDLLIVPMLFWRQTRRLGILWLLSFHLFNSQFFSIGIFPWLMILATPVLLPTEYFQKVLSAFGILRSRLAADRPGSLNAPSTRQLVLGGLVVLFVAMQVLLPFRHLLYPGNPSWTEEGHRFAWHMKLRTKSADASFTVLDPKTRQEWSVDPADYLSERQHSKMSKRPYMILQFCHYLRDVWQEKGFADVEVRANVTASLNGRRFQALIDPTVDLAKQPRTLRHCDWILPLREPLNPPNKQRHDIALKTP